MKLLYPLGLLGLIGIVILIIIYILKPNYQKKYISSTHVWKISLKYRKRKPPFNYKELLLLLCQLLIILIATAAITKPMLLNALEPPKTEKILILDASASMIGFQGEDDTRFERAVEKIREESRQMIQGGGVVCILLASDKVTELAIHESNFDSIDKKLDELLVPNSLGFPSGCSFGEADIDSAMKIAENYLKDNPTARILLYTAKDYIDTGRVEIIDVSNRDIKKYGDDREWNATIVDVVMTYEENYYRFSVEVASYNADKNPTVYFVAYDTNETTDTIKSEKIAYCIDSKSHTLKFNDLSINSFSSVHIYIDTDDSIPIDNHFYIYGTQKETINILYVTPAASSFFKVILASLPIAFQSRWDIKFDIKSLEQIEEEQMAIEGYDLYIFEYYMPDTLPSDGAILLVSPNKAPAGSGFVLGETIDRITADTDSLYLIEGESSAFMNLVNPSNIFVRRYRAITQYDSDYKPLMYSQALNGQGGAVYLLKNEPNSKIGILAFSSSYSDLTVNFDFPTIIFNLIDGFLPSTISDYVYDINKPLSFDQSLATLAETKPNINIRFGMEDGTYYNSAPYQITATLPGIYTISQTMLSGRTVYENFFVRIPVSESDFVSEKSLEPPEFPPLPYNDLDIYVYLGAALISLLFLERIWYASKEF